MTDLLDVNEQFRQDRIAQLGYSGMSDGDFAAAVAAGKLRNLGNGRFKVTDGGFDDGEIIQRNADGTVIAQHGLDTTTGKVALYTTTPAWHVLGNVIPGGISDIDQVMEHGGTAYEVLKRPVMFQPDGGGPLQVMKDQFVTYRSDTNAGLGVVGNQYQVIQNRQGFEFLEDLTGKYGATWESAGALREGRKVFCCMRLPNTVSIDVDGVNDKIIPFVVAINTHDGSGKFLVVVTPWRPACGNTERFAVRDAITSWGVRHRDGVLDNLHEARRTLKLSVKYYEQFAAEEEALARTNLAIDEFRKVLGEVWEVPDEDSSQSARTRWNAREEQLLGMYEEQATTLGRTAYSAERVFTEFADWKTGVRPGPSLKGKNLAVRATAMLEGTRDSLKSRAHKRLLERATH